MSSYGSIARASLDYGVTVFAPIIVDLAIQQIPNRIFSQSVRNLIAYAASGLTGGFIWCTGPQQRSAVMVVAYTAYKAIEWGKARWAKQTALAQELALMERASRPLKPRTFTIEAACAKMRKNSEKAIKEHREKQPDQKYTTVEKGLPSLEALSQLRTSAPLKFEHGADSQQGPRDSNQDAHFYRETDDYIIMGVLDGHGSDGDAVANYAAEHFPDKFLQKYEKVERNAHTAFESTIDEIHTEIVQKKLLAGSTATLCFIDKKSGLIYTANLGDSEANIYRTTDQVMESIPLSCVRDWGSEKDARRAADYLDNPSLATEWQKKPNPKEIYFPPNSLKGFNVSRALGEAELRKLSDKPGTIHKPKIGINHVQAGDIVILSCDGLKDSVQENEIIGKVEKVQDPQLLAKALTRSAVNKMWLEGDNVTVLAIRVS